MKNMPKCTCVINAAEKLNLCEKALKLRENTKVTCGMSSPHQLRILDDNTINLINEILETNKYNTSCHTHLSK